MNLTEKEKELLYQVLMQQITLLDTPYGLKRSEEIEDLELLKSILKKLK